ncbi:MAG: hypothetical protein EHM58_18440 [Ignavibacteriae bacterium]|nr:MAG: hypothetical protein EHM58_18440 [Ignavibacteriota bacterium]
MQNLKQKNKSRVYIVIVYFLITILLFYRSLNNFFSADDFLILLNITRDNISSVFGHVNFHFMPVPAFLYKLAYLTGGLEPFYFRLLNITVHSAASLVVFLLAEKIFISYGKIDNKHSAILAFLCGLLFCIHYIHTETIIYFSCLHELTYSLFYLCALLFLLKYLETGKRMHFYGIIIFFLLALLSKETALSFLLVLFFVETIVNKKSWQRFFKEYYLVFIAAVSYFLLRLILISRMSPIQPDLSAGAVSAEIVKNIIFSFTAMFFSLDFISIRNIYKAPNSGFISLLENMFTNFPWLPVVLLLVILFYYLMLKKKGKIAYFSGGLMILTMLSFMWLTGYERYLYLPSFGFCVLFLHYLYGVYNKGKTLKIISVLIFAVFALYNIYNLGLKEQNWITGSKISREAVNDIINTTQKLPAGSVVYFRDLPDNYNGSWIFRDGVQYLPELYMNRIDLKFEKIYDDNVHTEIVNNIYVFKYTEGKLKQD